MRWAGVTAGGGSAALLVASITMLAQQGDQLANLDDKFERFAEEKISEQTKTELDLLRMRHALDQALDDITHLERLVRDPSTMRPDAWTSAMDEKRMEEFRREIAETLEAERLRWVGRGGPMHLQELLEIQRAINEIPTDEEDAWTKDGLPRVQAVSRRLGKPISETQRNRAAWLLEAAKTLRSPSR